MYIVYTLSISLKNKGYALLLNVMISIKPQMGQPHTNGQPIAEVVQPVAHDDHPGQCGHTRLLEVLLGVGMGVAVGVVVLGVVVVQDVVVVVVVVMEVIRLAHRVVEVGVALVLAVLGCVCVVAGRGRSGRQHHLLLLRRALPGQL